MNSSVALNEFCWQPQSVRLSLERDQDLVKEEELEVVQTDLDLLCLYAHIVLGIINFKLFSR